MTNTPGQQDDQPSAKKIIGCYSNGGLNGRNFSTGRNKNCTEKQQVQNIPQFIQESKKIGQLAAKRDFRDWVRQQKSRLEG